MTSSMTSPIKANRKKSSKSSCDKRKALDDKWAQRFAQLEMMILASSSQYQWNCFNRCLLPIVTTERPFIPPVQSVTGTVQFRLPVWLYWLPVASFLPVSAQARFLDRSPNLL